MMGDRIMKKHAMAAVAGFLTAGMALSMTALGLPCSAAGTPDADRDGIGRLWKEYSEASENDLPQQACGILVQIKDKSRAERLSYDFFRASKEYVSVNARMDWRLRDSLTKAMETEFRAYGDPVVLYAAGLDFDRNDASECAGFLGKRADGLRNGRNSDFWEKLPVSYKGDVLRAHIHDDYEYVLLSMAFNRTLMNSRGYEKIAGELKSAYTEEYPVVALHGLFRITSGNIDDYEEYAKKYEGRATAVLARLNTLSLRLRELEENKAGEEEYRSLRKYCEKLISEKKGFTGEERLILEDEDAAEKMIGTLDASALSAEVRGREIEVLLQNLSGVKISVYEGADLDADKLTGKDVPVWKTSLENAEGSYHVSDTLNVMIPELSDGDYLAVFESGEIRQECSLSRHSIAMSAHRAAEGWLLYAADRLSGKPAGEVDFRVEDMKGKELLRKKVTFNGAVLMDSEVQSVLAEGQCRVQCGLVDSEGFTRNSEKMYISRPGNGSRTDEVSFKAQLLTDRSAYRPGETVRFKTILYEACRDGRMSTVREGEKIRATLADAEKKEVQTVELPINDFGSAAGAFTIPRDRRNGDWRLTVKYGGETLGVKWLTVDEFHLPSYSVSFIPDGVKHFPGDTVSVRGQVLSYAGNSISDIRAEYTVSDWDVVIDRGTVELDGNGDFLIPVRTVSGKENVLTLTLKITDGAGQTLEFNERVRATERFSISAELRGAAEGDFVVPGRTVRNDFRVWPRTTFTEKRILKGDRATFSVALKDSDGEEMTGDVDWSLSLGGTAVEQGVCASGDRLELDFRGKAPGLYTVKFSKTYEYGAAKKKVSRSHVFELLFTGGDALDAGLESMFKVEATDGKVAFLLGAADGKVWANVMLFDVGSHLLRNEAVCLEGLRGKKGSIEKFDWEYDEGWSDRVFLRVEYFRDGQHRIFEHEYQRYATVSFLPLKISAFSDSCRPGTEYRFRFRSDRDVEMLAAVFDKSTEDIRKNVWRSVTPQSGSIYVEYESDSGCDFHGYGGRFGDACGTDMMLMSKAVNSSGVDGVDPVIRKEFLGTLAFEPFLRSDSEGGVELRFRTSDKLSTFVLALFAHDRSFRNATLRREFVVSKPVAVTVHEPSLLYGGDRYVLRPSVSNNSPEAVEGTLTVFIYDGEDGANPVYVQSCHLSIGAGEAVSRDFAVIVPEASSMNSFRKGRAQLSMKVVFESLGNDGAAAGFSDAVLVRIPVLEGRQILTETHSAVLRAGADREALVRSLENQFVNTTHFGVIMRETRISDMIAETLAQKSGLQSDNLLDISEQLYVRLVSEDFGDRKTEGKEAGGRDGAGAEDSAVDAAGTVALVKKLLDCRCEDGGFAWFAGMSSSPVLTAVLLERLALLRGDGRLPEGTDWNAVLNDAIRYIDRQMFMERGGRLWFGGISTEQYSYVRSFFPETALGTRTIKSEVDTKRFNEVVTEVRGFFQPSAKDDRLNGRILDKARRNAAILNLLASDSDAFASSFGLKRRRMRGTLERNVKSLKEYAVEHPSGGVHYPNAVMPFRALLSSEAYAHSIICDMFTRWNGYSERIHGKSDVRAMEIADGIRLWLMVQKESQSWQSNFEFVNAVNSVRKGSPELMETSVISLSKTYEKAFSEIKASGNGFTITRQFLVEELVPVKGRDGAKVPERRELRVGETLSVGQKVIVRLRIGSDENRSLVHIRMPYNACLRPVRQLSGNCGYALRGWRINAATGGAGAWWITPQGYREVHEEALDYWFDIYPEQDTVLEDSFRVSQSGVFTAPVCEIESLYAPHYRANSAFGGSLTTEAAASFSK